MHRSAPGDDGRAGPRGSRERPVLGKVGLPSGRLRGRARAVGLGAGTDRSRSGVVAAAPGSLSGVRADAGAAAAERVMRRADAVAMIGTALLAKVLNVPSSTVRGWLRRIVSVAERVLAVLAAGQRGRALPRSRWCSTCRPRRCGAGCAVIAGRWRITALRHAKSPAQKASPAQPDTSMSGVLGPVTNRRPPNLPCDTQMTTGAFPVGTT